MEHHGGKPNLQQIGRGSLETQLIGQRLGSCEITQFIGKGGMGYVFKAVQLSLKRDVAIKILTKTDQDEKAVEWFRREAQAIARLEHPNIVQVIELVDDPELGTHYIVMQFVDGKSLDSIVRSRQEARLAYVEATQYVCQTAEGLEAAHKKNIVHRDVKPANLMVTVDGQVKITDFGLAKAINSSAERSAASGLIVGTPLYMAPEQCVGGEIDPRTDIYSLGASFYYLLTGKPPFTGENSFEILEKQITENPIPPDHLVPGIPPAIANIVVKMLAKNPRDRYQSCREVAEKLREVLNVLVSVRCPRCNRENSSKDTFTCQECGTKNLCRTHLYHGTSLCDECVKNSPKIKLLHATGADKLELAKIFDQLSREQKQGTLVLRSRDVQVVLYLTRENIALNQKILTRDQIKKDYPNYGPLEIICLILIQALSWENLNWEFKEEITASAAASLHAMLGATTDCSAFAAGYAKIIQIIAEIDHVGGLVISSPIESVAILYEKGCIKVASPVPSPRSVGKAIQTEAMEQILGRIRGSSLRLEYRNAATLPIDGISLEYSISSVFFEILYQCPDFSVYQTLMPSIAQILEIDPKNRRYQVGSKDLEKLVPTIIENLQASLTLFTPLEKMGVPSAVVTLLWGAIVKEKLAAAMERLMQLAQAFQAESNEAAAETLLNAALGLFPSNIKLLEQTAASHEREKRFERAAFFWNRCGKLREEAGELPLARSCFEKSIDLDPNQPDFYIALLSVYHQLQATDDIKKLGTTLLPILRKVGNMQTLVDVCKQLVIMVPDMLAAYKELVNYYLDHDNKEEAVDLYEKLAEQHQHQGQKEAMIRIYQKLLKLAPERQDIAIKLNQAVGKDQHLAKILAEGGTLVTTSAEKPSKYGKPLLIIGSVVLALFVIILGLREIHGMRQLSYFQAKIAEEKFSEVQEELLIFMQSFYLLGTGESANQLYTKAKVEYRQALIIREKAKIQSEMQKIMAVYMPQKAYQKILYELQHLQERVQAKRLPASLADMIDEQIGKAKEKLKLAMEEENKQLYIKAEQSLKDGDFLVAKQTLESLASRDPETWAAKVEQQLAIIREREKERQLDIDSKRRRQETLFEEAQKMQSQGQLEEAIANYRHVIQLLPDSDIAQQAKISLEKPQKALAEGMAWIAEGEKYLLQKEYDKAIPIFEKLITHPSLGNTSLVKNLAVPVVIETLPVSGISCMVNGQVVGVTPCVYRYALDTNLDIKVRQIGFEIEKKEEKRSFDRYLNKLVLHLKRVPIWKFSANNLVESPVVVTENQIYLGSRDCYLYGLDKNGKELWKFYAGRLNEVSGEIKLITNKLYFSTLGGSFHGLNIAGSVGNPQQRTITGLHLPGKSFRGGPCIAHDLAFVGSSDGYVYAMTLTGGKSQVVKKYKTKESVETAPVVVGSHLLAASGSTLYCFGVQSGEVVWQYDLSGKIGADLVVTHDLVFVPTTPGGITAFHIASGKPRWDISLQGGTESTPAIYQNLLVVGGSEKDIMVLEAATGKTTFTIPTNLGFATPIMVGRQMAFLAGKDFQLYCADLENGKLLWQYPLPEKVLARPVYDGQNLYISAGNVLYVFRLNDDSDR